MWGRVTTMLPAATRMLPGRRNRGMNTATAMLIGAGIGIATWEMMRRTNAAGNLMNGNMGNMAENAMDTLGNMAGINNTQLAGMADEVMDAIK